MAYKQHPLDNDWGRGCGNIVFIGVQCSIVTRTNRSNPLVDSWSPDRYSRVSGITYASNFFSLYLYPNNSHINTWEEEREKKELKGEVGEQ